VGRGRVYKAGKRVPGEKNVGIIATASGNFEAFVSYSGRRVTAGTKATIEEAREARDARLLELQGGGSAASLRKRRTPFAEYFENDFLKNTYNKPTAPKRDSTMRSTLSRYATYLKPFFGHRALIDITGATIMTFITKLAAGEFQAPATVERVVHGKIRIFKPRRVETPSSKTQREVLMLLRATLDAAFLANPRLIPANPFPPKSIPRGTRSEETKRKKPLSPTTIMKIVNTIPSMKHRTIAATLAFAGLRLGEALALKWGDIGRYRRGYLSVERSADAKTRKVGPPKTVNSIREVPLDPALVQILQEYRKSLRAKSTAEDWMFPSERQRREDIGNPPIIDQRVFAQRFFEVARKKVAKEQHITPHTLRHLWCSRMVTLFPVADVAAWAGHASASFTFDRYVKMLERPGADSPIKTSIYDERSTQHDEAQPKRRRGAGRGARRPDRRG
jgi:integrase